MIYGLQSYCEDFGCMSYNDIKLKLVDLIKAWDHCQSQLPTLGCIRECNFYQICMIQKFSSFNGSYANPDLNEKIIWAVQYVSTFSV